MIVPIAALAAGLFYLSAVPVKLAFALRAGEESGWGAGISLFEGRFAVRSAQRRMRAPKRQKGKLSLDFGSLGAFKSLLRAARYLLRHVHLDALEVRARVGLSDAALTALSCGAIDSLACALGAASDARLRVEVAPDFSQRRLTGEISGMITLRMGHIMLAALIGTFDYGNGRLSAWTDTRLKTS